MRLVAVALVVTAAIAVTAAVFAVWPAVATAPWETERERPSDIDIVRCEAALELRRTILRTGEYRAASSLGGYSPGNPTGLEDFDRRLRQAENEIERYCE